MQPTHLVSWLLPLPKPAITPTFSGAKASKTKTRQASSSSPTQSPHADPQVPSNSLLGEQPAISKVPSPNHWQSMQSLAGQVYDVQTHVHLSIALLSVQLKLNQRGLPCPGKLGNGNQDVSTCHSAIHAMQPAPMCQILIVQ